MLEAQMLLLMLLLMPRKAAEQVVIVEVSCQSPPLRTTSLSRVFEKQVVITL